ncbi:hypothetical protein CJU89_6898 [Yarrowia sp. B02]|nr:hypothetical protein CJU89_6898 [Yarrowia sp. B02]
MSQYSHFNNRGINSLASRYTAPAEAIPTSPERRHLSLQPAPTLTAPVNFSARSIPQEIRENTFYISVSAFYDEPSMYPCILECYNAAANLLGPGVVIKHNSRHTLLKQWMSHIFSASPEYPRVLLVDSFLGQLVGDLFNDQEFSQIINSRKLKLVHLNHVYSLNNSLNIPFEVVDKAFKEYVSIHSSSTMGNTDYSAHTECCYKRAAAHGFSTATMQRGWAKTNLEKVWRAADVVKMNNRESSMSIEAEKQRIRHAWQAIANRRAQIDEWERNTMTEFEQQGNHPSL